MKVQSAAPSQEHGCTCNATTQLLQTTILSDGLLKKRRDIASAAECFTDIWRGSYPTKDVAVKAIRTYPIQDLKEAEKVRRTVWIELVSFFFFDDSHRSYRRRQVVV